MRCHHDVAVVILLILPDDEPAPVLNCVSRVSSLSCNLLNPKALKVAAEFHLKVLQRREVAEAVLL